MDIPLRSPSNQRCPTSGRELCTAKGSQENRNMQTKKKCKTENPIEVFRQEEEKRFGGWWKSITNLFIFSYMFDF